MSIWHNPGLKLEEINAISANTLVSYLDMKITELGQDFIRGTMPVDPRTHQPMRLLHGGASCALAESLASIGSNLVIDPTLFMALGQSLNANHLRPVSEGLVTATARVVHLGRSSHLWDVEIHDNKGKLAATVRMLMAVVPKKS
jgi:1,4-dihydroxy-2-naphthoyl-CoA hydrolase